MRLQYTGGNLSFHSPTVRDFDLKRLFEIKINVALIIHLIAVAYYYYFTYFSRVFMCGKICEMKQRVSIL